MKKATFTFPDHNSLWLFKERSKAINVRIQPAKNTITGLFCPSEIDVAVQEFKAVYDNESSATTNTRTKYSYRKTITASKFNFRKMLVNLLSGILP